MKRITLKEQVRIMPVDKINKLKLQIEVIKDSMLLAYTRNSLQPFLACTTEDEKKNLLEAKKTAIEKSVEDTFKEEFIKIGNTEPPLGDFLPNKGLEKYHSFNNLRKKIGSTMCIKEMKKQVTIVFHLLIKMNCSLESLVLMRLGQTGWIIIFA